MCPMFNELGHIEHGADFKMIPSDFQGVSTINNSQYLRLENDLTPFTLI